MVTWISENCWWIIPTAIIVVKVLIEIFAGGVFGEDITFALKRSGLEFCFIGLSFYGISLVLKSSKFYNEWQDIQIVAAPLVLIVLVALYIIAAVVYKKRRDAIGIRSLKQFLWWIAAVVPGIFAIIVSLNLF